MVVTFIICNVNDESLYMQSGSIKRIQEWGFCVWIFPGMTLMLAVMLQLYYRGRRNGSMILMLLRITAGTSVLETGVFEWIKSLTERDFKPRIRDMTSRAQSSNWRTKSLMLSTESQADEEKQKFLDDNDRNLGHCEKL